MKYKEDLRIIRTRKHLSNTIITMMQTQSLEKISVIDICREAIVNRATFYAHFEDKYHLLSFALEELKDEIYSSLNKDLPLADETDALLQMAYATFDFVKDNKSKIATLLSHNRNEKVIGTIKDSLSRTAKQHLQKTTTNIPPAITSVAFAGALADICLWYLDNTDKFTEEDMHSYLTSLFSLHS